MEAHPETTHIFFFFFFTYTIHIHVFYKSLQNDTYSLQNMETVLRQTRPIDVRSTCSDRSFVGQSQEAFLLQDKTRSDKHAGAHGQGETNVEVQTIHLHLKTINSKKRRFAKAKLSKFLKLLKVEQQQTPHV